MTENLNNVTFVVCDDAKIALQKIQMLSDAPSLADALRRSIRDALFLQEMLSQGYDVWVVKGDEQARVVWPKLSGPLSH